MQLKVVDNGLVPVREFRRLELWARNPKASRRYVGTVPTTAPKQGPGSRYPYSPVGKEIIGRDENLLVDDHEMFRLGLIFLILKTMWAAGEAANGAQRY